MNQETKFQWYKKVAWNFPSVTNGMLTILLGYLNFYLTENVLLSAGTVGLWLMASKVFDGFTDLIAGYIIEKTNTRWGKGRPYSLFSSILWIFVIALFSVPSFFSTTGKLVYVFICYTLIQSVCQTLYGCADQVYMMRAIPNEKDRSATLAIGGVVVTYFCAAFSIAMPLITANMSGDGAWSVLAIGLGIPCMILAALKFFLIKEVPLVNADGEVIQEKSVPLKLMIKSLFQNKYAFLCFGLTLVYYFGQNLNTAVQTYYFTYVMGNLELASLLGVTSIFTPIILLFIPGIQAKLGKTKVIKIGFIINLIACVLRVFAPTNMIVLIVSTILIAIGTLPFIYFSSLFLMDSMDYGEWKMGYRVESCYSAVSTTAGKVAAGISSGISGIVMELTGFVSGAEVQTERALNGIYILMIIVPIIIAILLIVLIHFYDLDDKIEGIKQELLKKRMK